jgi:hypothetical protein
LLAAKVDRSKMGTVTTQIITMLLILPSIIMHTADTYKKRRLKAKSISLHAKKKPLLTLYCKWASLDNYTDN